MNSLLFIWATVNTLLASWISYMLFFNIVVTFASRTFGIRNLNNVGILFLVLVSTGHFLIMFLVNKFNSIEYMTLITTLFSLHWCIIAYFLLQRFSSPVKKTAKLSSSPNYMIKRVLFSAISLAVIIFLFFDWYLTLFIILAWIIYGYGCTELAIRNEMKFMKIDRHLAISSLNDYQGRSWSSSHKYPFPNFL